MADVYRALTYDHDHSEEMAAVERRRREVERRARDRGMPTIEELADRVDGDTGE